MHANSSIPTIQPDPEGNPTEQAARENREARRRKPSGMTVTARLRKGWRSETPTASKDVPLGWRNRAWKLAALGFLFVLAMYGVWYVIGRAN